MVDQLQKTVIIQTNKSTVISRPIAPVVEVTATGPAGPGGPEGVIDPAQIDAAIAQYLFDNPIEAPDAPQEVVVSNTEPAEYEIWFQTGLGNDGSGFTIWFKDNT